MVGNDRCTVRAGAAESHRQPIYKLYILPFGFVARFRLLRQPESPKRWESRKISFETEDPQPDSFNPKTVQPQPLCV